MSIPPEREQYDAYVGRIARGAGITSFGQGTRRILGYATQVALAQMYGPAQLGFYVLGITAVQLANVLAQFGMDTSVVRYVARYQAEGDVPRLRGTILLALWTTFALSLVLAGLMFIGAGFLANRVFDEPLLETVFEAFSISLPLFTVMSMALRITQGFQTVKYMTLVQEIFQPLVNLGLIVAFYFLGARILGATVAYIISMAASSVLALYYLRRIFPLLLERTAPAKLEYRAMFGVSGPMIAADFTGYTYAWITLAIVGIFSTTSAVGIFNAAARTAAVSTLVLVAFSKIFSPMVSNLYSRGLLDDLDRLYKDVARWSFSGAVGIFLITALLAKDIMGVFGPEFEAGWPALIVISAAQLFTSSMGPALRILAMTGRQRTVMFTTVGSAVLSLVLGFALIPQYGILGAAVAMAVNPMLANTINLLAVYRFMGLWPYGRQYSKPILAASFAALAVYFTRLAVPPFEGIVAVIALVPLYFLVYGVTLWTLGLAPSDRQLLKSFWMVVGRSFRVGA